MRALVGSGRRAAGGLRDRSEARRLFQIRHRGAIPTCPSPEPIARSPRQVGSSSRRSAHGPGHSRGRLTADPYDGRDRMPLGRGSTSISRWASMSARRRRSTISSSMRRRWAVLPEPSADPESARRPAGEPDPRRRRRYRNAARTAKSSERPVVRGLEVRHARPRQGKAGAGPLARRRSRSPRSAPMTCWSRSTRPASAAPTSTSSTGTTGRRRPIPTPMTVGHEYAGEIAELGANVQTSQGRPARLGRGPRDRHEEPRRARRALSSRPRDARHRRQHPRRLRRIRARARVQHRAPARRRRRRARRDPRSARQCRPYRALPSISSARTC